MIVKIYYADGAVFVGTVKKEHNDEEDEENGDSQSEGEHQENHEEE